MTQSTINLDETSTPIGGKKALENLQEENARISASAPWRRDAWGHCGGEIFQGLAKSHDHNPGMHSEPGLVPRSPTSALTGFPGRPPCLLAGGVRTEPHHRQTDTHPLCVNEPPMWMV